MRKLFLLVLLFYSTVTMSVAYRVPLIDSNSGIKYINATMNGVKVRFVLDTGCSKLSTNKKIFASLLDNGSVKMSDLSSTQDAEMANGYTHMVNTYPIKTFQLGEYTFVNMEATVGLNDKDDAEPLLGNDILRRMKYYKVVDNYLEFEPKPELEQRAMTIADAYQRDSTSVNAKQVVEALMPYYQEKKLDLHYSILYALALYATKSFQEALNVYNELQRKDVEYGTFNIEERIIWAKLGIADQDYGNENYEASIREYQEVFEAAKDNAEWEKAATYAAYSRFYAICNAKEWGQLDAVCADFINYLLRQYKITINELAKYSVHIDPRAGEVLNVCYQLYSSQLNSPEKALWYKQLALNVGYVEKAE